MLTGALNDAVNNNTVCQKLTEIERLDVVTSIPWTYLANPECKATVPSNRDFQEG